jgi:integrase
MADAPHEAIQQLVSDRLEQLPNFEERVDNLEQAVENDRYNYARGIIDQHHIDEAEDILRWAGINLNPQSQSLQRLARELQAASIRASEAISQRNQGEPIATPDIDAPAPIGGTAPLLSKVAKDWIAEKSRTSWVEKTTRENTVWINNFILVAGDKQLNQYSKADGRAFKSLLMKLPPNWNKQKALKGMDIISAADKAAQVELKPMAHRTANKIMQFVGAFWNWAAQHYDECPTNPIAGLQVTINTSVREEREPFSLAELQAIFKAPIYTGCKSAHFWRQPGKAKLRGSGLYWVPLISLFTGARAGEIIQLYVDDVREDCGIVYFDINRDGEDKRLKNNSSIRKIPAHKTLMDIGLAQLVRIRREHKEQRLFPDLLIGADGYYSSPFSKLYKRFLESVNVKHDKVAFHSFRHCFEDACRNSGVPLEVMNALQGHSQPGMAGRYGSGYSLKVLAGEIAKVQYDGLDLSHLFRLQPVLAEKSERVIV